MRSTECSKRCKLFKEKPFLSPCSTTDIIYGRDRQSVDAVGPFKALFTPHKMLISAPFFGASHQLSIFFQDLSLYCFQVSHQFAM